MITYFDNLSQYYYINEICSFGLSNYYRRKLVKMASTYERKHILDIMSGRGENLKYINQKKSNALITTLDFSKSMNSISKNKQSDKIFKQLHLVFFNYNTNSTYDIILCSFGIKTLTKNQYNSFAEKLNSLLSMNGEVLLLELSEPKNLLMKILLKFYLSSIVPTVLGRHFKPLYYYIEKHKNLNELKNHLRSMNLKVIKHEMSFFSFELLHLKKCANQ